MKLHNSSKRLKPMTSFPKSQKGIALIMVLVVLLVLTLVGLSSTDSSNFQALMVRNNQFRLEAFNTSFTEIETQLNAYRTKDGKDILFKAVDGQTLIGKAITGDTLPVTNNNTSFTKEVELSKVSGCPIFNESIGGFKKCHIMVVDSDSKYSGTNIGSDQVQQFSFYSF